METKMSEVNEMAMSITHDEIVGQGEYVRLCGEVDQTYILTVKNIDDATKAYFSIFLAPDGWVVQEQELEANKTFSKEVVTGTSGVLVLNSRTGRAASIPRVVATLHAQ